jgi:single-strand DNA-binding protein
MVLVEGHLNSDDSGNPRTFTRQDGSAGASYEVTANTVRFLGGRGDTAGGGNAGGGAQGATTTSSDFDFGDFNDDDFIDF